MVDPTEQPQGPTEAQKARARPYLFKAIKENNMQNLAALFQAGFPLDEFVAHPSITALMLAASIGTPASIQLIL